MENTQDKLPSTTNVSPKIERAIKIAPSDIQRIAGQNSSIYQLDVTEEQLDSIVLYQQGEALALAYDGEFVLAIDDFFNPANNLALSLGGSLVFNAESPVVDDGGVIWRRKDESGGVLFWVGTGAGAAALGAAAGGGGGGGGGAKAGKLNSNGTFTRSYDGQNYKVDLWLNSWANGQNPNGNDPIGDLYLYTMPPGVLTTQGLA